MSGKDQLGASFFKWAATVLVRWRKPLFVLVILACVGSLFFARNIRIDNSLELWFLEEDPTLVAYREFKTLYGNDEIILALVDCRQKGLFATETVNLLYKVSKEIKADKANIKRVLSVAVAPYIGLEGQTLVVEDIMKSEVADASGAAVVAERFFSDPLKKKLLIDLAQQYAVFLIEPVASQEMDEKRPVIIQSVRDRLDAVSLKYKLAGMGVMYDELNRLSMRDGAIFTGLSYLTIAGLVYFLYRSLPFLGIVITVMVLGGSSFFGVYGLFKQNFNMVTIVLPTLMMILSLSDVAYVFNNYCYNIKKVKDNQEEGLIAIFFECLSPCLFTSITNGLGFLTIVTSPMLVLRGFGVFAAMSCMGEYVISMIAAAFILGLIKPDENTRMQRPFEGWIDGWVRLMPKHYKLVMGLLVVAVIIGGIGISKLKVDTYSMGMLHASNGVRQDSDTVEAVYGNYLPLEIRISTNRDQGVKDPAFLRLLDKTHTDLEALPRFQRAASILDVFKKLNQVWTDGATASYRVPENYAQCSQLMTQYESDPDNDLRSLCDPNFREARVTVRVPMVSAAELYTFEEQARKVVQKNFGLGEWHGSLASAPVDETAAEVFSKPASYTMVFGGYVPLYARLISYITYSQVSSFAWALVTIFGTMALLLRRWEAILLGIVPNVFPIVMTLGMMGHLGINLDIATVTIASIALGIAVDDTIHELFLFYDPERAHLDPVESISETLIEAGPAVVSTSIIYALGFGALVFASIKSVILFGGLLAVTIVFGMLCEITILPALICTFRDWLDRSRKTNAAAVAGTGPESVTPTPPESSNP